MKQLAGYPMKKVLSTFVADNRVVTGKAFADGIDDIFVPLTKEIRTLDSIFVDDQLEGANLSILPEFIIREEDLYHKLSFISTCKSSGPDGIRNWVLKFYAHVLASPVASIFSASVQQAVVPTMWKKS